METLLRDICPSSMILRRLIRCEEFSYCGLINSKCYIRHVYSMDWIPWEKKCKYSVDTLSKWTNCLQIAGSSCRWRRDIVCKSYIWGDFKHRRHEHVILCYVECIMLYISGTHCRSAWCLYLYYIVINSIILFFSNTSTWVQTWNNKCCDSKAVTYSRGRGTMHSCNAFPKYIT